MKKLKLKSPIPQSSSIFAVVCSATPELRSAKFFSTADSARKNLKLLADERRHKMGVQFFEEKEDRFSYCLGWEQHKVVFYIVELTVSA